MEGLKENHASDKEIFALQRTILELKHTVEAAKREVAVVSNERNSLRIKLQSANDQHIEEV